MSIDITDDDVISVEVIDPAKPEHKSEVVSNVFYGPKTKQNAKRVHDREEAFYKFVKSLNQDTDGVRTETTHFNYTTKTTERK